MKTPKYYRKFSIPKKSGLPRELMSPLYSLRIVQKWILREILDKIKPSTNAMAFRKGNDFGILAHASKHSHFVFSLCLDLNNFYSSISTKQAFYVFRNIGYNNFASTILSHLCTVNGILPQGGICSPSISNLVCRRLDKRLENYCNRRDIAFSRYADDFCFSCNDKIQLRKCNKIFIDIITDEGFTINENKTRYYTRINRREITGLVLAPIIVKRRTIYTVVVPKKYKEVTRAMIHRAIITGDYNKKNEIRGRITFTDYIEKKSNRDRISYYDYMRDYIMKCASKICWSSDLVNQYNNNKLFSNLPNIIHEKFEPEYLDVENIYLYDVGDLIREREDYLRRINANDIVDYNLEFGITNKDIGKDVGIDNNGNDNNGNSYPW